MEATMERQGATKDTSIFQNYINNFRIFLSPYLKPGMGIHAKVIPYNLGSIIQFSLHKNEKNIDEIKKPMQSLQDALRQAQIQVGEDPRHPAVGSFKGTNIIVADNNIFLIKERSEKELSKSQAKKDIDKIIENIQL